MDELREYQVSKNLISYISPNSTAAEAYRALRTNLFYSSVDKKIKSITISSADIQDGKTVTACNLAISIANAGSKVLLIDADLRKPNVHKQFIIPNRAGLTNLLMEECELGEALFMVEDIPNLDILVSGTIPPNPSEILSSIKIKELIEYLSKKYDLILIDSPPLGYVSDGIILAGITDGVILTVAAKVTKINHAQTAVKDLQKVDANILGVIMTKVKRKSDEYRYY